LNYVPRLLKITGAAALIFALLFSGLMAAPSTYAASPVKVGEKATITNTDGDTIRVRKGAGTDNEQIAEAHEGQVVTVLAGPSKDAKGTTWYKIDAPGGTGWVMSAFLSGTSTPSTARPAAAKSEKPAAVKSEKPAGPKITGFGKVANTDGDPLRVRSAAGTKGSVITTLSPGASVAIKAGPVVDSENITWYQVSANGVTGWAMGQYLVQSKAPAAPVAETKPAAQAKPEPAKPAAKAAPAVAAPAAEVAKPVQVASTDTARTGASRGAEPPAAPVGTRNSTIVNTAMKYVGYRYRYGGSSPSGFDCSGFVYYVVNRSGGSVGRTIPYQINSGTRISRADLQPGDLVFFSNTYKRGLSHAGIYIGNGKFIHAGNERSGVLVSSMNTAYWTSRYTGATRTR
jgi:cell wall-associated NlpC family hydrolase